MTTGPRMWEKPRVDVAVAIGLLVTFSIVAYTKWEPYTFLHGDGTFYANINKSLLRDHSLDQGRYHPHSWFEDNLRQFRNVDQGWSNVSLGKDGRWLPKHSWVLPLFSTPFFALFGLTGLLIFHVLALTLLMLAAYKVATTWLHPGLAACATLITAMQPIVSVDIYSYNNDVFYSALLLCGLWAFLRQRMLLAGVLFGIGVWAKLTNLLFVFPFGIWLLWRWDKAKLARAVAGFAVPIVIMLGSNWYLYGSPTASSYQRIIVRQNGLMTTESISERFKEPFRENLKKVFTDEREGVVPKAPLLLLSLLGAVALLLDRKSRAIAGAYLAILVAFVVLHGKYHYIYSRFFLPVAALGVLPVGALLRALGGDWWRRPSAWLRPRIDGRFNPIFPAAVFAAVALLWILSRRVAPPPDEGYRLSDHVEEARVHAGKQRCDYFNNQRQKFECPGDNPHIFFWGRALGEQCTFGGEPRSMLSLHPPRRGGKRRIAFANVPAGKRLRVMYGLAETSKHNDLRFTLRVNGAVVPLPPVKKRGQLLRQTFEPAPTSREKNQIEIEVRTPRADWRHFCFDALVE